MRQYGCMQEREGLLTDNKVILIEGQDPNYTEQFMKKITVIYSTVE